MILPVHLQGQRSFGKASAGLQGKSPQQPVSGGGWTDTAQGLARKPL